MFLVAKFRLKDKNGPEGMPIYAAYCQTSTVNHLDHRDLKETDVAVKRWRSTSKFEFDLLLSAAASVRLRSLIRRGSLEGKIFVSM